MTEAPCVVVDVDDADARMLNQALNRLQGEDNPGLRAELVRKLLREKPITEVLSILPDTAEALTSLASMGEADIAASLRKWQAEQAAKLKHMIFQMLPEQVEVIEEALSRVETAGTNSNNPNQRGNLLFALCRSYLRLVGGTE